MEDFLKACMYYSVSFPATTCLLPITNKGAVQ